MNIVRYRLEGEIRWQHDAPTIAQALGLNSNTIEKILALILKETSKTAKISEILQSILENNDLTFAEVIYGVFLLGNIYEVMTLLHACK